MRTTALDRTARLARAELARRGGDLRPLADLAPALGVPEATVAEAAMRDPDMGVCGPADAPLVWSLPSGPIAAGFAPRFRDGRMQLVLGPGLPLVLSDSQEDGRLGQTLNRIYLMADRWLLAGPGAQARGDRFRRLYELIASTWFDSPGPQPIGDGMRIYRADHGVPIATRFWTDGSETSLLEVVVRTDSDGECHLVNAYPGGTHCTLEDA